MNEQMMKLIASYRETQRNNLKMFNYVMAYISISSGLIEMFRMNTGRPHLPNVVSMFNDPIQNSIFSTILIILGFLIIIFQNKIKIYRVVLFLLTCLWGWVAFSYLFTAIFISLNFKHVLIVPIIAQLFYMMRTSAFIDEIT